MYLEDLCFDEQQAAEKALKAVLVEREVRFPYVHDLATLPTLIDHTSQEIPPLVRQAGRLTRFAVTARYPSVAEPVTESEYQQCVAIADAVVEWAAALLDRTTSPPWGKTSPMAGRVHRRQEARHRVVRGGRAA